MDLRYDSRTPSFDLEHYGDPPERFAWPLFLRREFPQYEAFWQVFVVGLTERILEPFDPQKIGFLPQDELGKRGRRPWHVAVAQLHYTTLLHLVRVFEIRLRGHGDRDSFIEAIARLQASTDTAFELLGRCVFEERTYKPWDEKDGQTARIAWRDRADDPLDYLRKYRNGLLHGRVRVQGQGRVDLDKQRYARVFFYQSFERMGKALDWRRTKPDDLVPADQLLDEAWDDVLGYFRTAWSNELLPWARQQGFRPPELPRPQFPPFVVTEGGAQSLSAQPPLPSRGSASPGKTPLS